MDINAEEFARDNGTKLVSLADLRKMARPKPIIQGVLYQDQEHVIFGGQGSFKSFAVIDWMLSMAYGVDWLGRATLQGASLYVCGEGGGKMLADRMDAWLIHHNLPPEPAIHNIHITEEPVLLLDEEQVSNLILAARSVKPQFIGIDTLMANMGGDENDQADMANFTNQMRRIRLKTSAGVAVVHHTGHQAKDRPQGANALRRNVDIELRIDADVEDKMLAGVMGGSGLKSKNTMPLGMVSFRMQVVSLNDKDEHGAEITSLVLTETDEHPDWNTQKSRRSGTLTAKMETALDAWLDEHGGQQAIVSPADWSRVAREAGLQQHQQKEIKKRWISKKMLTPTIGGHLYPANR